MGKRLSPAKIMQTEQNPDRKTNWKQFNRKNRNQLKIQTGNIDKELTRMKTFGNSSCISEEIMTKRACHACRNHISLHLHQLIRHNMLSTSLLSAQ